MDYDVWYCGQVIGRLQADTDRKATNAMHRQWAQGGSGTLIALRSDAPREKMDHAKMASAVAM
jgi:hypothetical protein